EDGIRDSSTSRGLGDVYKRQDEGCAVVDEDECVDCGACEDVCPIGAIKVE
ncbi:ferredoxin, partial [Methanosarcina mazei]